MQDPNCVFCKIIAGEIPAKVIMQNEKAMALLDAFPLAAGHSLVIPKSHYAKVQQMSEQDAMAMFEIVWKLTGAVETGSQVTASTIAIHNGSEAGQEVPHVHAHIVPRKRGDGAGPIHSMFKIKPKLSPQEMDSLRERIASNLSPLPLLLLDNNNTCASRNLNSNTGAIDLMFPSILWPNTNNAIAEKNIALPT